MSKPNPWLTLSGGVLIIGFAAILIRNADAPGPMTAFYRLAIGTSVMALPFYLHWKKAGARLNRPGIWLAVAGGFFFAMDMALWSAGIVLSGAAIPTLMVNTAPLWVGLGALLIFRERQPWLFWVGLFVAVGGSIVVMRSKLTGAGGLDSGGLLGLAAAVFYAGYHLVSQKGRGRMGTLAYFWISSASATVTLLFVNILLAYPFTGYSVETYVNFAVLGIVVQCMGWLLVNYSQGYLPASVVAPALLGQPVMTAVFAWALLGEALTTWQISGGVVVLIGIYVVQLSRRRRERTFADRTAATDASGQVTA